MKLYNEDCIKQMQKMIDEGIQVDSIVTDPPYELGFMGKKWDSTGIAFQKETWELAYQLLKPGGHLLAFGGSRTYHRMVVAIEDAGFEIRDQIMWLYGSGFPKSLNIGKAVDKKLGNKRTSLGKYKTPDGGQELSTYNNWKDGEGQERRIPEVTKGNSEYEGWGTALKPAHEPVVMARKPIEGSVADNVLKHGTGGINIDESRVAYEDPNEHVLKYKGYSSGEYKSDPKNALFYGNQVNINPQGRFPANVIHDGSVEVLQEFPITSKSAGGGGMRGKGGQIYGEYKGKEYDKVIGFGDEGSAGRYFKEIKQGRFPANVIHDGSETIVKEFPETKSGMMKQHIEGGQYNVYGKMYPRDVETIGDEGSAARFFYCAKASKRERNKGLSADAVTGTKTIGHNRFDKCAICGGYLLQNPERPSACKCENPVRQDNAVKGNNHPTVKPVELMKYLCKLVTPKGGTIFDPFMGSGTTGMAAKEEGFDFIGIEKEEDYYNIAEHRINNQSPLKEFM